MKLTCPACGAALSADAAANDAEARQCLATIAQMPEAVARFVFAYISLFRPSGGRGLRWSRARRMVDELYRMILAGDVRKGQMAARQADPAMWRQAMEQVVNHPPARLPLRNHNYLIAIVYDLADAADRTRERESEQQLKMRREMGHNARPAGDNDAPMTPADFAEVRRKLGMRQKGEGYD